MKHTETTEPAIFTLSPRVRAKLAALELNIDKEILQEFGKLLKLVVQSQEKLIASLDSTNENFRKTLASLSHNKSRDENNEHN